MEQNFVLGSGKLYFDQFAPGTKVGTGELYLGNTPEFSVSRSETTLKHWDADNGKKVQDRSVSLQEESAGKLVTDNISPANLALWFAGSVSDATLTAQTAATAAIPVKRGRFYQLGVTDATPAGARGVSNVVIKVGVAPTAVAQPLNYEVDGPMGRIFVLDDAVAIVDDDVLNVVFDVAAGVSETIVAEGAQIEGALRFISVNSEGLQKDHFYPYVKLTSSGDYALKGDDWQKLEFSMEILQLAGRKRVYVTSRAV